MEIGIVAFLFLCFMLCRKNADTATGETDEINDGWSTP